MKIVIAPDSFKGSLSAMEVCRAVRDGIHSVDPGVETVMVPMADGGEGTVSCLVHATNGEFIEANVMDPLGRDIRSRYGVLGDKETCVIEVASASGLPLLQRDEYDPMRATSFGTGQLILDAFNRGYRKFVVALGGSATNDMGAGIFQALGGRVLNAEGEQIPFGGGSLDQAVALDMQGFDPRVRESTFILASDVNNPLVGETGASVVFGPQKGATPSMVTTLDHNLSAFADLIFKATGITLHNMSGAGAAGGIGAIFLAFFPVRQESGIELVIRLSELRQKVMGADLVITGEGKLDSQTKYGKTPRGVAETARELGVPTLALVGSVETDVQDFRQFGIASAMSIVNAPMTLQHAIENAPRLVSNAAEQVFRVYTLRETTHQQAQEEMGMNLQGAP